jgi:aspartate racemase
MPPLLHVGVLGHSADGAALCLLEIVRESARKLGDHRHPEVTLSILEMGPTLLDYERHNLPEVRAYLSRTARRLADAGCDFFICPDNTAHIAVTPAISPLPPLDSTRLLAHAAVASAIGGLLPAWRGGPEWT